VHYASWRAPDALDLPDVTPGRPVVFTTDDGTHLVAAPLGGTGCTLLIVRTEGPAFHRIELLRLPRLVEIVVAISADRLGDAAAGVRAATGDAAAGVRAATGEARTR